MRLRSFLVALAVLLPCAAGAQTTTVDGVQALARGDYATAVRILRPLAEDSPHPDPLAQFFMATLYQTGHGVALNWTRACSLYLRAATTANPLMTQSLVISNSILEDTPLLLDRCTAGAIDLWSDPPVASFTLEQEHWVMINQAGFTVGYRGLEKRANMGLGGPGLVFLPIRYIPVDVTVPVRARRHFIQFAWWAPSRASGDLTWALWSMLYEVIGPDIEWAAAHDNLETTADAKPATSGNIESVARVRANAAGEAEWVVAGPNPLTRTIPYPRSR